MARGYWLPENYENLPACDGFYVDADAVYANGNVEDVWETVVDSCIEKLIFKDPTLIRCGSWRENPKGPQRFVLARNDKVDIILEDVERHLAVYALIPEDCEFPGYAKRSFPKYLRILKESLTELYPGHIRHRTNSWNVQKVG